MLRKQNGDECLALTAVVLISQLIVLTSLSSEAHANHPQVTEILGEVKGDVFRRVRRGHRNATSC